jgi:pyruvate/2-oxoglutarate dehydrogenase complex dihydrolipoamide acyltransferase (E2) component
MHGVRQFSAFVSPPQSSVLAIGEIRKKFLSNLPDLHDEKAASTFGENGLDLSSKVRQVISMTLSADERVIHIGLAQKFLNTVRHYLEAPTKLL